MAQQPQLIFTQPQGGLGGLGGYVSALYSNMFNRNGTPDEVSYWANSGLDQNAIANAFANSGEYRATQIPLMYQSLLGRTPDPEGMSYYLNSGLPLAQIDTILGNSPESQNYFASLPLPDAGDPADNRPLWEALSMSDLGAGNRATGLLDFYTRAFGQLGAADPSLAASALLGQFGHESPGLIAAQPEKGGGGGDGIAQWTYPSRKDALNAFRDSHQNMNPLEVEGRFALNELMTNRDYKDALASLLKARDPASAMRAALNYEQPKGWSLKTPENSLGYDERLNNLNALRSFAQNGNTDLLTPAQRDAFFRMQGVSGNDANKNPMTAPMPTPRPDSLFPVDTMLMPVTDDNRLNQVNQGLDAAFANSNDFLQTYTNAVNAGLLNFNANGDLGSLGFATTPTFGSSGTFGQPTPYNGMLTVPNIGNYSSSGGGDGP